MQVLKGQKVKPVKRWRAKRYETYYCVNDHGVTVETFDNKDIVDDFLHRVGDYFQTLEQSERYRENSINKQRLKDLALELNNGVEIDWKDRYKQKKYYFHFDHRNNFLAYIYTLSYQNQGTIYCLDVNFKAKAIELIGENKLIQLIKDGE